jgi:hypothetical protein
MRVLISIIICSLLLLASECQKEGKNCHYHINIVNNANIEIIVGNVDIGPDSTCIINNEKNLPTGSVFEFRPFNFCIERSMSDAEVLDIYFIDPVRFNIPGKSYGCDSIEIMNKVLVHHILTLEDLKDKDFVVEYP